MQFELIKDGEGQQSLTVYIPELDFVRSVRSDQTPFKAIKRLAYELDVIQEGEPEDAEGKSCPGRELTAEENQSLIDLFEVAKAIERQFVRLGERFTTRNGLIYRDGDPLDANDPWVKQVLAFIDQGVDDWMPLVAFRDKLDANPNEHSRDQFFNFLQKYPFTITDDGDVVLYKGVNRRGESYYGDAQPPQDDDVTQYPFESCSSGPDTIVDGEVQPHGRIKQGPSAVVEHPRSKVHFNPSIACSNGLHCGTYQYARGFGNVVLRVLVNPRDVVNVPSYDHKVRVCRYRVLDVAEQDGSAEALLCTDIYDGVVTGTQSPGEAPYVPSQATYDVDEGDPVPELISDATEPQSPYTVVTSVTFTTEPLDLQNESVTAWAEEERCCECGEYDADCVCDEEESDFCDDCMRISCECVSQAGQDEEDLMTSLSVPIEECKALASKPARKRYPSPAKWAAIQTERKLRKKGIRVLAEREGWVLDGEDPSDRKSWVIPPKS